MTNKFTHSPVFPIVPCYTQHQLLDIDTTIKYALYLIENGAEILMTTSGTTQFNLLSNKEILLINQMLAESFPKATIIMGLKSESFLATQSIIKEYNKLNFNDNTFLMLKYPERYYDDDIIERYFHILAECSDYPLLVHCEPLRHGVTGEIHDYTAELINKICSHKNIVGIKEETSDLMLAYDVVKDINVGVGVVCAGRSQRRFNFLEATCHGQMTFLAGVGSLFPTHDIKWNDIAEDRAFSVFFKYGWHPSLRYALQCLDLIPKYDRQPWPTLAGTGMCQDVENVVEEIKGLL